MRNNKQMCALLSLSLFLLLSGCCSFPLVDCGPLITELQVSPKETTIDIKGISYTFTFERYNFNNRRSGEFISSNIDVQIKGNFEVIFKESEIYYFLDGKKIHPKSIDSFNNHYYISFPNRILSNQIYINGIIKVNQNEEKFELIININDDTPLRSR